MSNQLSSVFDPYTRDTGKERRLGDTDSLTRKLTQQ